jgi:hypothetical protein
VSLRATVDLWVRRRPGLTKGSRACGVRFALIRVVAVAGEDPRTRQCQVPGVCGHDRRRVADGFNLT